MTITTRRSAHPAADGQAGPATSQAWRLSRTAIPLMGPADPAAATPLMGPASPAAATPLMGPADPAAAIPLMGPADPSVTPLMSPRR